MERSIGWSSSRCCDGLAIAIARRSLWELAAGLPAHCGSALELAALGDAGFRPLSPASWLTLNASPTLPLSAIVTANAHALLQTAGPCCRMTQNFRGGGLDCGLAIPAYRLEVGNY